VVLKICGDGTSLILGDGIDIAEAATGGIAELGLALLMKSRNDVKLKRRKETQHSEYFGRRRGDLTSRRIGFRLDHTRRFQVRKLSFQGKLLWLPHLLRRGIPS